MQILIFFGLMLVASSGGARDWIVDASHAESSDEGSGCIDRPFETISQAAWVARPGDTVRVYAGIYRERVAPRVGGQPGQAIVYEAAANEAVVIRGSDLFEPRWQVSPEYPTLWIGRLDASYFEVDQRHAQDWPLADFPKRYNPFAFELSRSTRPAGEAVDPYGHTVASETADTPAIRLTLGQVFLNGRPMLQVHRAEVAARIPGSFFVQGQGESIWVNFPRDQRPPGEQRVEITTRPRCFAPYRRGLGHITVRGFVMEHGATDYPNGFYRRDRGSPQAGILSTRGGHHWTIENNVVRFGTSLGIDIGREGVRDADGLGQPQPLTSGDHVIRFNEVTDHGAGGIHGIGAYRSVIAHNVLERNNRLGFRAAEIGAIKLHFFVDGVVEHNLIRDNDCFGIWLDNVWHRARVHGNLLINNQGSGIFMEMGHGPALIDHNLVMQTRSGSTSSGVGDGLYAHDASGVTVAHNLFAFNAGHGVYAHLATDRKPWVYQDGMRTEERRLSACSNWVIRGNLLWGNSFAAIALPPETPASRDNVCDFNGFAGVLPRARIETFSSVYGPPTFGVPTNKGRADLAAVRLAAHLEAADPCTDLTLEQWRTATGFDTNSRRVMPLRAALSTRPPTLTYILCPAAKAIHPPLDERLTHDYFGNPRPGASAIGPFVHFEVDPRVLPESEIASEATAPGRGPYHVIDPKHANVNWLWPKPISPERSNGF